MRDRVLKIEEFATQGGWKIKKIRQRKTVIRKFDYFQKFGISKEC